MIQEVFRAEGLPLDLAYVPLIESAFKPNALSRAKAKGMWQFMSGTALENGLQHDWYIDERADPEKATHAAAKYLKTLHSMFEDWHLALASYNGGPGRVQRAMKRSGREDFWQLSATSRYLPRETRDYVPLILAAIVIARNPSRSNVEISPDRDAALRDRHGSGSRRSSPRRRMGWRSRSGHPGPEPRTAPLDDAGTGERVPAEGADGFGRHHQRAHDGAGNRRSGATQSLHRRAG